MNETNNSIRMKRLEIRNLSNKETLTKEEEEEISKIKKEVRVAMCKRDRLRIKEIKTREMEFLTAKEKNSIRKYKEKKKGRNQKASKRIKEIKNKKKTGEPITGEEKKLLDNYIRRSKRREERKRSNRRKNKNAQIIKPSIPRPLQSSIFVRGGNESEINKSNPKYNTQNKQDQNVKR